jgi:hypothetical protein
MIIRWKKNNPVTIPLVGAGSNAPRGTIRLIEGLNKVEKDEWEIAKKHLKGFQEKYYDEIKDDIKVKKPVMISGKEVMKEVSVMGLSGFEAGEAIEMIDDCFNVETLEAWLVDENRDEIRAAIKEKLSAILDDNLTKEKQDKKKKGKKKGKK